MGRPRDFKRVGISYSAAIAPMVLFHAPSIGYIFDPGAGASGGFFLRTPPVGPPATVPISSVINGFPAFGILPSRSTYGFAVMPLGFQFDFIRDRRVHPIAEINGGIVASKDPVPYSSASATGLNFLVNFGGGVRWHHAEGQAITAGYRFVHVSNAGTSAYNPGLDNNLFYLSYSFLR